MPQKAKQGEQQQQDAGTQVQDKPQDAGGEVKGTESQAGTQVATTQAQGGAVQAARSVEDMMEDDAGAGFENADKDSFAIPFIAILQSGSPQCKKSDGAYIKGAEEGMLFQTVSQDVIDGEAGVLAVPCYFVRRFTRWGARDAGGGLKGEYAPNDPILQQCRGEGGSQETFGPRLLPDAKGEYNAKTSDVLNDTRTHYVLLLRGADGKYTKEIEVDGQKRIVSLDPADVVSYTPAVFSVTSTQIRKSRMWMSKMDEIKLKRKNGELFTPPMFSHIYHLTTVPEQNDQGSWYGWKIELLAQLGNPSIYAAARAFRDAIKRGEVKTQPLNEQNISGNERPVSQGDRAAQDLGERDIPF